ncbi:MAG: YfhL family 4Fe-4S dicluster ferredoxin [Myxococcota bacterium]|nr:YfhL family 4Fe-4S dicluster ferredoxin [Myxococcota bacterium]
MSTRITPDCIDCGLCVEVCPNEAIHPGSGIHEIDPQRCTECVGFHAEEQCAVVCPVDCCILDAERVESEARLFERARKLHPKRGHELVLSPRTSRFRA